MSISASEIRLGSTSGPSSRLHARVIARQLEASWPEIKVVTVPVTTQAERQSAGARSRACHEESLFQELETALREDRIDLAVHSITELPVEESPELVIGAVIKRLDARDVLISNDGSALADLPAYPRIGASGLCRRAQVLLARPDARPISSRGELDTQLRQLQAGEFHAILLALCDLQRSGLSDPVTQVLDYDTMLPAPGQGAIAVQCRAGDEVSLKLVSVLHHPESWATVTAERAFVRELGAGGDPPVAAYAEVSGVNLRLSGLIAPAPGSRPIRVSIRGLFYDPASIGETLAEKALALGAGKILRGCL